MLPRGISRADGEAILRSCDRRTAAGQRDYAILMVLLRLGLRVGEVAVLKLNDIEWDSAEITVHGKGQCQDRLPLPADVGKAVVAYLRGGRPRTTLREVFLTAKPPFAGLGSTAVSQVVYRACERAGVTPIGAHRLRHTVACEMVGVGVPLQEIAQVLRHRSISSTAVYARADIDRLRAIARPWPKELER
ncbi:MAG: tyrosine-type recombinase/integrase [Chloroflexi bacterium]|nr:tyrosine-type recombinase/integrase [Chloroflexota bacterium]